MDVTPNELGWIAKHLGHSINIHKNHYQVMTSTIEKAKIAKLLILADRGEVAKYSGKTLDDIEIDGTFNSCTYNITGCFFFSYLSAYFSLLWRLVYRTSFTSYFCMKAHGK